MLTKVLQGTGSRCRDKEDEIYWFSSKKLIFITVKRKLGVMNAIDFIGQLIIYIFVDINNQEQIKIESKKNFIQ